MMPRRGAPAPARGEEVPLVAKRPKLKASRSWRSLRFTNRFRAMSLCAIHQKVTGYSIRPCRWRSLPPRFAGSTRRYSLDAAPRRSFDFFSRPAHPGALTVDLRGNRIGELRIPNQDSGTHATQSAKILNGGGRGGCVRRGQADIGIPDLKRRVTGRWQMNRF